MNMTKKELREDKEREERITMEIVVDAYGPEEQAMGWYYYLEEKLQFPFAAVCNAKRTISPLRVQDKVDVIGMAPEKECEKEIFVLIRWEGNGLAVPLSQLTPINATETRTKEAVEDWHYWVGMGYKLG
jgi:hypothetical protein